MKIRLLLVALLVIGMAGCGPDFSVPTDYTPHCPDNFKGTWSLITIQQDWNVVAPTDTMYACFYPYTVTTMELRPDGTGQVTVQNDGVTRGTYPCTWFAWSSLLVSFDISGYSPPEHWGGSTSFTASGDTLRFHCYNDSAECTDTEDNTRIRYDWAYEREQG